jgi:hypothetical protein
MDIEKLFVSSGGRVGFYLILDIGPTVITTSISASVTK